MKWAIIATWEMSYEGICIAKNMFEKQCNVNDCLEKAINNVENNPNYTSVAYGGLPNQNGYVELDGAFMDGKSLSIGAVAGIQNIKNPVSVARTLKDFKYNTFLVGRGAENYALDNGFTHSHLLTNKSKNEWIKRLNSVKNGLDPYDGHDTVGMVALDGFGNLSTATSTSGLFMKKPGRVGDSPLPGCGYYADCNIGGASATGLGEDIMKGCTSYEMVRLMEEGYKPQEAAEKAVLKLHNRLTKQNGKCGDISVICLNKEGEFGAATNIKKFPFVVATDQLEPTIFYASFENNKFKITKKED